MKTSGRNTDGEDPKGRSLIRQAGAQPFLQGEAKRSSVDQLKRVRMLVAVMIAGLAISGLTAMPVVSELELMVRWFGVSEVADPKSLPGMRRWIDDVWVGLKDTDGKYPFLLYGYDWLAFGHFVIALAFVGAWRDPVRNVWLFEFGMIACAAVIPFALVAGHFRGIPIGWRLIDCAFGVVGFLPLWLARRMVAADCGAVA